MLYILSSVCHILVALSKDMFEFIREALAKEQVQIIVDKVCIHRREYIFIIILCLLHFIFIDMRLERILEEQ